ncbi:MAG: hypothetical protein AB7V42_04810 [Thermoleophilia bacterium]
MSQTDLTNMALRQRLDAADAAAASAVVASRARRLGPLGRLARRLRRDVPPYGAPPVHAAQPAHRHGARLRLVPPAADGDPC